MPSSRKMSFTLIILLIMVKVLFSRDIRNHQDDICLSLNCNQTASRILEMIDMGKDPCDDFYQFACGNFIKNKETVLWTKQRAVNDEQMRTLLEKPIEKDELRAFGFVKSIYQACMNISQIRANVIYIKEQFEYTGGWPILEGDHWNESSFNLQDTMHKFMEIGFEFQMFFIITPMRHIYNSPEWSLQLSEPKSLSLNYDYETITKIFGSDINATKEIQDVKNFNLEIRTISTLKFDSDQFNMYYSHENMTMQQLQSEYPYMNWLNFFNKLLKPIKTMNNNDVILVQKQYFRNLGNLLRTTTKRTISNYMYWKAVEKLKLPQLLELDDNKLASRWETCLEQIITPFSKVAISALYVRNFFDKETKKTSSELAENIRHQFTQILSKADWMDEITKEKVIEKLENIAITIGYPDELLDDKILENYFENFTMDPFDNYFESMRNITQHETNFVVMNVDKILNKNHFFYHVIATAVNGYYVPTKNNIEIPAGILQGDFYSRTRPQYMNYGAMGFIIGHEFAHSIDTTGGRYDKNGDVREWWQNHTKQEFDKRKQCLIDQYGSIVVPEINLPLDASRTEDDNIADNGGINKAYLAYKKWSQEHGREQQLPGLPYTPEQMFWISFGNTWCSVETNASLKDTLKTDEHAPNHYRVNLPIMNSEFFSKDFKCPLGSKMNPKEKCKLW